MYVWPRPTHVHTYTYTDQTKYPQRKTNEAAFVYYGLRLFETPGPDRTREKRLAEYAHKVHTVYREGRRDGCLIKLAVEGLYIRREDGEEETDV